MYQRVIVVGYLGKDPEVKFTQGGQARCIFPIAVNETWNDKEGNKQERVEWFNVVAWGKTGENVGQFLSKGRLALVEGQMRTRSWEKDGTTHYMTELHAQRVQFMPGGNRERGSSGGSGPGPSGPATPDDDVPF